MKKGYGMCPGTCGELVQGLVGNEEFISSYCIDLYSKARIFEKASCEDRINGKKSKSYKAIKYVFERFGYSSELMKCIDLNIKSNIPVGKGMASSTADIGASVMAALDFLGESMTPYEISSLVSKIEPTDSIFFKEACIFNPSNGVKKKSLGYLDFEEVLILEPRERINTVKLKQDINYNLKLKKNMDMTKKSFQLLEKGIKKNDSNLIKRACLNSAYANESIKKTKYISFLEEMMEKYDCGFMNISHTGTVVGMAIGKKTDVQKLIYEIEKHEASKYYDRKYVRKIIPGGIRDSW